MILEPLKGKWKAGGKDWCYTQLKSALEWMIQIHEDTIDQLIKLMCDIDPEKHEPDFYQPHIDALLVSIFREYHSIQILEAGLEDVI